MQPKYWFRICMISMLIVKCLYALPQRQFTLMDTVLARQYYDQAIDLFNKAQYDSSTVIFIKANQIYQMLAQHHDIKKILQMYVKGLVGIGRNWQRRHDFDKSFGVLEKARKIALEKLGELSPVMYGIYNAIGNNYYYNRQFDAAYDYYRKAFDVVLHNYGKKHAFAGKLYNNFANIYLNRIQYDTALVYYQKALDIARELEGECSIGVAIASFNIGWVANAKANYDKSIEYTEKSLEIRLKLLGPVHPRLAQNYNLLGNVYYSKGDYARSLEYYQETMSIVQKNYGSQHRYLGYSYNNIGMIYFEKQEYATALEYFNRALKLKLKSLGPDHPDLGNSYANIGHVYTHCDSFDQALKYLEQALAIRRKALGEQSSETAATYLKMSLALTGNKKFAEAHLVLQKALAIYRELFGERSPHTALIYSENANVFLKQNRLKEALENVHQAVTIWIPALNDSDIYHHQFPVEIELNTDLLQAMYLKAKILAKLSEHSKHPINELKAALELYQNALSLADRIRVSYRIEGSRLILGQRQTEKIDEALLVTEKLYQKTGDLNYRHLAFQFAEKAKAGVLLTALQDSRAKHFAGIPDSILDREQELEADRVFYQTRLQKEAEKKGGGDRLKIVQLQEKRFELSQEHQKLITEIEGNYPRYYNLKYQTRSVSVAQLQARLPGDTALLEYFMGDSLLRVFVVSKTAFKMVTLPRNPHLTENIGDFLVATKKIDMEVFDRLSFQIYGDLFAPIEQYIADKKNLILIPHEQIAKLPFEVLISQLPQKKDRFNYSQYSFLIKHFNVMYHYSATLYSNGFENSNYLDPSSQGNMVDFIGFAPVFSDLPPDTVLLAKQWLGSEEMRHQSNNRSLQLDGVYFSELKYAEQEVREIIKLFHQQGRSAQGYFHLDASKARFLATLSTAKYLHIATHSIVHDDYPQLSAIIFAQPTDSIQTENNTLYAGEIYNLNLKANLVVLSSCESGLGQLVPGEGLMALSRGFFYAGVANLLVSLWKVDDKYTSDLMVAFYRHLLKPSDYAPALRQAKLALIKNPLTAFPRIWSGFILLGSGNVTVK